MHSKLTLGIETSCDDTCVALVDDNKNILVNLRSTQKSHQFFGGVVPELAAMEHLKEIKSVYLECKKAASENYGINIIKDISTIAVTTSPGLFGSLFVGVNFAKGLASVLKKTLIPVDHLLGHMLCARLCNNIRFPYLAFLASGGHTIIARVENPISYKIIGQTIDDAIGEGFDKIAIILGMDYPGGPIIETMAAMGDSSRFQLPVPMNNLPNCDISISGLKTATKITANRLLGNNSLKLSTPESMQIKNDIAASFQKSIITIVTNKLTRALKDHSDVLAITLVGGVAANKAIRAAVAEVAINHRIKFASVPQELCVDNAAMIAWAGIEKLAFNTQQIDQ